MWADTMRRVRTEAGAVHMTGLRNGRGTSEGQRQGVTSGVRVKPGQRDVLTSGEERAQSVRCS